MDRKSILILVVCVLLFFSWSGLVNRLYPPQPIPEGTNTVTNQVASGPSNAPVATTAATPAAAVAALPDSSVPEELAVLEDENSRYTFTSHGGGLKQAELKKYRESVGCGTKKILSTNKVATLNARALAPAFTLLGDDALVGDAHFALTKTANSVRAEKSFSNGSHLTKEFRLGTNFMLGVTVTWENRTNQPLALPAQEWVIGTATPLDLHDNAVLVTAEWFDGRKPQSVGEPWFANKTLGCFPGTPRNNFTANTSNIVWAAVQNRFFTMVAILPTNAPASQILVRRVALPPPSQAEIEADPKAITNQFGFQTALVYPATVLAPNQTLERRFDVFAGPKEYRTLDRLAARFRNDVDLVMGFGGFFGFFSKALLLSMNWLNSLGLSYGLTIIGITFIIKLLFWPITQAQSRSMKRMARLQPQMKVIQEKYKDDPKKMQQKLHEFWKEHKINPAAGCLPIVIQIPVFIGFYKMLQSAIELRGASFFWACDLSQPDTIWVIPGLNFPVNPLPLIMGATQLWQMRLTPPSPGVDPVQAKIMQYMPLMFLFILYNFSSGLTLYWTVQNLLSIAQMKLTKATEANAPGSTGTAPRAPAPPPKKKK
jgi:YidC/Oxa1 family membrane protein insertase